MRQYLETTKPNKQVKIDIAYYKGTRRDNSDRGYRVYITYVELKDQMESFMVFRDHESEMLVSGIARKSPKMEAQALSAWNERKEELIASFCKPRDITLI